MAGVLVRRGKFGHRDTIVQKEDSFLNMEAETVVFLSQAKKCQVLLQPSEPKRGKDELFPRDFGGI